MKTTRDIPDGSFAEACYNENSISELEEEGNPDEIDMRNWNISAEEWRQSISLALEVKKAEKI